MKHFIYENKWFFPLLIVLWIIGLAGLIYNPSFDAPLPVNTNYTLLSLSLMSFLLVIGIAVFLFLRWMRSKDKTTLIWSVDAI